MDQAADKESIVRGEEYIQRLSKFSSVTRQHNEKRFAVEEDHSNMVKFNKGDDKTYQNVRDCVEESLSTLSTAHE